MMDSEREVVEEREGADPLSRAAARIEAEIVAAEVLAAESANQPRTSPHPRAPSIPRQSVASPRTTKPPEPARSARGVVAPKTSPDASRYSSREELRDELRDEPRDELRDEPWIGPLDTPPDYQQDRSRDEPWDGAVDRPRETRRSRAERHARELIATGHGSVAPEGSRRRRAELHAKELIATEHASRARNDGFPPDHHRPEAQAAAAVAHSGTTPEAGVLETGTRSAPAQVTSAQATSRGQVERRADRRATPQSKFDTFLAFTGRSLVFVGQTLVALARWSWTKVRPGVFRLARRAKSNIRYYLGRLSSAGKGRVGDHRMRVESDQAAGEATQVGAWRAARVGRQRTARRPRQRLVDRFVPAAMMLALAALSMWLLLVGLRPPEGADAAVATVAAAPTPTAAPTATTTPTGAVSAASSVTRAVTPEPETAPVAAVAKAPAPAPVAVPEPVPTPVPTSVPTPTPTPTPTSTSTSTAAPLAINAPTKVAVVEAAPERTAEPAEQVSAKAAPDAEAEEPIVTVTAKLDAALDDAPPVDPDWQVDPAVDPAAARARAREFEALVEENRKLDAAVEALESETMKLEREMLELDLRLVTLDAVNGAPAPKAGPHISIDIDERPGTVAQSRNGVGGGLVGNPATSNTYRGDAFDYGQSEEDLYGPEPYGSEAFGNESYPAESYADSTDMPMELQELLSDQPFLPDGQTRYGEPDAIETYADPGDTLIYNESDLPYAYRDEQAGYGGYPEDDGGGARAAVSAAIGLPVERLAIAEVPPGSVAERAMLQPGDLVLAIDGLPVNGFGDLASHDTGNPAQLHDVQILRDRVRMHVTVDGSPLDFSLRTEWIDPAELVQ